MDIPLLKSRLRSWERGSISSCPVCRMSANWQSGIGSRDSTALRFSSSPSSASRVFGTLGKKQREPKKLPEMIHHPNSPNQTRGCVKTLEGKMSTHEDAL